MIGEQIWNKRKEKNYHNVIIYNRTVSFSSFFLSLSLSLTQKKFFHTHTYSTDIHILTCPKSTNGRPWYVIIVVDFFLFQMSKEFLLLRDFSFQARILLLQDSRLSEQCRTMEQLPKFCTLLLWREL